MKILLILILILPLLWCGGSDTDITTKNQPAPRTTTIGTVKESPIQPQEKPEAEKSELPKIKEIKFTAPGRVNQDLELAVELEVPDISTLFEYRWFVNDQEIPDATTQVLPSQHFKSGDWIHCRIRAMRAGLESGMVKSKHIMIQGTPPVLDLLPVGAFEVPDLFTYQIRAIDPDADEFLDLESTLTYELVSPQEAGIEVNPQTGEISWDLTEELVSRLGTKIEIKFKVIKKGAPTVGSSITLNFSPSGEQQEPNPDENTEE